MGNLGESLRKRIKSLGIERQVEAVGVVEQASKEIANLIPAGDFEVVSFNRGTLKVRVSSASLASELNMNKGKVLDISKEIKSLRVQII